MTEEYRNEMKYYKQLALAVERRISDLNVCLDDSTLYSTNTTTNLPSDTDECFDQTNMSYDYVHDRSSFSFIGDHLTTDLSETKPDEMFNSNDFESMNSQVTIIDMSSENKNEIQIPKDRNDNKPQKRNDEGVTRDTADGLLDSNNTKLWTVGKIRTDNNSPSLESPSSESVTKKVDPLAKSPYLRRTPSKDNVLGSGSAKNMKTTPTNNPLKKKKITPMMKENISPAVVGKKPIPKGRSPYELPKVTKKTVIQQHKLSPAKNITGSLNNISSGLTSPPKLVRQNSYTLESPSPLLLAHLEVQSITSGIDVGSISMSESTSQLCQIQKNRSVDNNLDLSTSIGSDINSLSLGEVSTHIDETPRRNRSKISDFNATPVNSSENKVSNISNTENLKNNASASSSTNMRNVCNELFKETETIKHNASEHSASTHLPRTESSATSLKDKSLYSESDVVQNEFENKIVSNGIEILSDLKSISSKDSPKVYFDFIMRKFQEDHEKQMNALIQKQHDEQLILKKTFENQQKVLLDQFQTAFNTQNQVSKKRHSSQAISVPSRRSDEEETHVGKHKTVQLLQKDNAQHSSDTSCSDSMEKYLTISADVLNTSRCLLINRKTVNLSPTDIQCVNVMPRQSSIPCIMGDGEPSHSDRISAAKVKEAATKKYHKISSLDDARTDPNSLYLRRTNNDSYFDANRSFQGYEEMALDESLDTARTNNTLDDLNFSFASDDGAHTNKLYTDGNRNEYFSNNSNNDYEKASKLKNARSKISEIQKNLASQTLSMTRSLHSDSHYLETDRHLSASDQAVSLSSIDVMSDYYTRNYADRNHLSLNLTEINKPSGRPQPLKRKYKCPEELQREVGLFVFSFICV